jgi:hypothetical protein
MWYNEDEEEEDLLFSPALMARRASESWINTPPIEVIVSVIALESTGFVFKPFYKGVVLLMFLEFTLKL